MIEFALTVIEESYNFQYGDNILEQQLSKGLPRQRSNFIGAPHQFSINVLCENDFDVQYLWNLYGKIQKSPDNFLIGLQGDHGKIESFKCRFQMGKPPSESTRNGNIIIYQLSLWAEPIPRDSDVENAMVNFYASLKVLNDLDFLVNVFNPINMVGNFNVTD